MDMGGRAFRFVLGHGVKEKNKKTEKENAACI